MIDVGELLAQERECTVKMGGKAFKVWYNPTILSIDYLMAHQVKLSEYDENAPERLAMIAQNLCDVLVRWELADKGVLIEIAPKTLSAMPLPILSAVQDAIEVDQKKVSGVTNSTSTSGPRRS